MAENKPVIRKKQTSTPKPSITPKLSLNASSKKSNTLNKQTSTPKLGLNTGSKKINTLNNQNNNRRTLRPYKKPRRRATGFGIFIVILLLGILVLWLVGSPMLIVNYKYYYVDDSLMEYYSDVYKNTELYYEPLEIHSEKRYALFNNANFDFPTVAECTDDDPTGWEFEWFGDVNLTHKIVVTENTKIPFADKGKTFIVYALLVDKHQTDPSVVDPSLPAVIDNTYVYVGDYYNGVAWNINSLNALLRTGFHPTTYNDAGNGGFLIKTDTYPGANYVYGIYNGQQFTPDWLNGKNYEREHVWCNSLLGMPRVASSGRNQASDLHNLRAIGGVYSGGINQTRSNKYMKDCGNHSFHTGHSLDSKAFCPGYGSGVLDGKPIYDSRGDIARIYLYMIVMYKDILKVPASEAIIIEADSHAYDPNYAFMPIYDINVLIAWNAEDPVDAFEINRNEIIYQLQGNRNPFIDHQEKVSIIIAEIISSLI